MISPSITFFLHTQVFQTVNRAINNPGTPRNYIEEDDRSCKLATANEYRTDEPLLNLSNVHFRPLVTL